MHGLGILLFILVRILLASQAKGGGQANARESPLSRPLIISFGIRVALSVIALLLMSGRASPVLVFGCLLFAFPLEVVSLVFVPAGVPHLTYYFTRFLKPHSIVEEAVGGATFYELRARVRRGFGLGAESTERLSRRLAPIFDDPNDRRVRGATLTARGMLDVIGGGWDPGRDLFNVVQDMRWLHAPRSVRAYCQGWLLADAAARGAHHEVIRLSRRGPATRRRAFLEAAARRLLGGAKRPSRSSLVARWLAAPSRWNGLRLLRSALAARPRAAIEVLGSDLSAATRATVRLVGLPPGAVTRRELFRVAAAWQGVFASDELHDRFVRRRDELGAHFGVTTLEAVLDEDLTELFAELLRNSLAEDEPDGDEPPLITAAKDALQSELLGELEDLAGTLPVEESRRFYGFEQHWRSWARVRSIAATFFDLLPERRSLVYESVGSKLWSHAVWLHNAESAFLLAHDIFRWLYPIAPSGSEEARTLEENARIGRGM